MFPKLTGDEDTFTRTSFPLYGPGDTVHATEDFLEPR
jgi:hypothetical protein